MRLAVRGRLKMAREERRCGWCYGTGYAYTVPHDAETRPHLASCKRCSGSGKINVYVYTRRGAVR